MSEQITLKERMEARKENFMLRVDTHTDMVGQGLSKITPLMTQATSALTVGYASYEGVNMFFNAHFIIAVLVGLVAGVATEGIGFIAVDERDKAEAHNRRTNDEAQHIDMTKAHAYVYGSFIITVAIVAAFESIPAVIRFWNNEASLAEVLFRCGLLVFPFLSRLGANIFAFRSVRESVDTLADDQELRRLKLSLAKQELIAKSQAKIEKVTVKSSVKPTENFTPLTSGEPVKFDSVDSGENENFTPKPTENFTPSKTDLRRQALLELLAKLDGQESSALNKSELSRRLDVSRPTLLSDLTALQDSGKLTLNGHVRVSR